MSRLAALALALALSACAGDDAPPASDRSGTEPVGADRVVADLVVHGAAVTTLDPERPEAAAVAVADGEILRVGSDEEILALAGPDTRVVDAGGRRLIPGLNDSHAHVVRGGRFYNLELRWEGVPTLAEALDRVRHQAERTPEGQWVRVIGGWSPYQFEEKRMPTVDELNAAAPDTPVFVLFLYSQGLLNRAGLEALGITAETEAPPGSRYEIGPDGEPTGLLLAEPNPTILYRTISRLPGLSPEEQLNSTKHFYRELARFGLTSASDAGGGGHLFPRDYEASRRLAAEGEMALRVSYFLFPQRPGEELEEFRAWVDGNKPETPGNPRLVGGYVLEGGGEFLTWSAGDFENFLAPRPEITERPGMREELKAVTELLVRERWPYRIHATYDESISTILDVFEEVDAETPFDGLRFFVDHAETISPENLDRVKALGGGIAIQSRMAFAGEFFRDRYGAEAASSAPPLRLLVDSGVPLGVGSDATRVSSYNPWVTLYWLVTGRTAGGTRLASTENRLDRLTALELHTVGSARVSGEESIKGRIAPGQLADFALLSKDYFAVPEDEIRTLESVLTVLGGEVVYAADEYAGLATPLPPVIPEWSPVALFGGALSAEEVSGIP